MSPAIASGVADFILEESYISPEEDSLKDTNLPWKRLRPVHLAHCPAQDLLFYLFLGATAPISRLL